MKKLIPIAALLFAVLGAPSAFALPAFCTGSLTVVTSGTFVAGSTLVGTGNCIEAADKIFGGFTVGGAISGGGSAGWLFTMTQGPADVTLAFQGLVGPNSSGFVDYEVAVDPANSNGAMITELEKDFTFNSLGAGSTATLTGTTTPAASSFIGGDITNGFQCTRTANTSTCPDFGFFSPSILMLAVDETIKTGANTNVTALTDTVFQAVDEPSTLALLSAALIVLGLLGMRMRRNGEPEAA